MDFSIIYGIGVLVGISTHVYVNILTDSGMILSWWRWILNRTIGHDRGKDPLNPKEPIGFLWKPLLGCAYCVSGQGGLWTYFFIIDINNYSWIEHFGIIAVSIFTTDVIQKLWKTLEKIQQRKR